MKSFHDCIVRNRQSLARSLADLFRGKKWFEDSGLDFEWYAMSGITNTDLDRSPVPSSADCNFSLLCSALRPNTRDRMGCIDYQVQYRLIEFPAQARDER